MPEVLESNQEGGVSASGEEEVSSETNDLIDESIKNMESSPDLSPLLSTLAPKPRQYKPKLDPSLILQEGTKRERRETKKFVAKTSEAKDQTESDEAPESQMNDSYAEWYLAKSSKRKERKPKKSKGADKS